MAQEITYAGWTGTNNRDELWELKQPTKDDPRSDLSATQNIDLDDKGLPSMRDGFDLLVAANKPHSGYSALGVFVYVRAGVLYRFYPSDKTYVPLLNVYGDTKMRYWTAAGRTFFTNGIVIGEIVDGTATLFEDADIPNKEMIWPGQAIAFFRGRLYTFTDDVMSMSNETHVARMDSEGSFKWFPENGRVIAPCSSETSAGIFAGTEKAIYYGEGSTFAKMAFIKVADFAAKDIPIQYIEAMRINGLKIEGSFPLITTDAGICLGLPQGQLFNLTEDKFVMPPGSSGTSVLRIRNGVTHYITAYR